MRRPITIVSGLLVASSFAVSARADDTPTLDWEKPTRCMTDLEDKLVRVQCDPRSKRCLVAPGLTSDGGELGRSKLCESTGGVDDYRALKRAGYAIVPSVAEAPPGFQRSKEGRAYQVQFDLLDRVYIGAAWAPTYRKPDVNMATPAGFPFGRARVEVGMTASVLSPRGRSRHDFRVLEGTASFSDMQLSGLVFAYDYQHVHRRPAFWVTSFFGAPSTHPVPIPFGWGVRTLKVEDRLPANRRALDLEVAEVHMAWNPLQSRDLYSHLRLEAGADVGSRLPDRSAGVTESSWYSGPTAAVRSRLALGKGGLHYLFLNVDYQRPMLLAGPRAGRSFQRVSGSAAYEGVLIAVNDQPISIRLAAQGGLFDDPVTEARTLEVSGTAGLRFSFWAPPRSFEPLPEIEDP